MKRLWVVLKQKRILLIIIGGVILVGVGITLFFIQQKSASRPMSNIYLSLDSLAVKKDAQTAVDIRITPATPVDTVTATLKYDADAVKFVKATYSDSPFSSQIPAISTGDTVTVQAAKLGGQTVSSDAFVARIVFSGLKDGTVRPELTDGNAALAGVAVNPLISGKEITRATASATSSTQQSAQQNDQSEVASAVPAIAVPAQRLLTGLGVDSTTAATLAPWVTALVTLALLGVLVFAIMRMKKSRKSKPIQEEKV